MTYRLAELKNAKELLRAAEAQIESQSKRLAEWEACGIETDSQIGHLEQEIARLLELYETPHPES